MSLDALVCTVAVDGSGALAEAEEVLTLARRLTAAGGQGLRWLVLGAVAEEAVETARWHGVTTIEWLDLPRSGPLSPDACVEALAQCARRLPSRVMVFPQTPETRLVAARLAGRLDSTVVTNVVDARDAKSARLEVTAAAYGGDTRVVFELNGPPPHVLVVPPSAVAAERLDAPGPEPKVLELEVDLQGVEERIRVVQPARAEGPRLEDAQVIVAGGRGLGSAASYALIRELADALGGVAGASRPIVDEGWVDASRQIGLTGRITRPALYIAAGISGASQHMAGCSAAKTIVAINRDPDAAIFRHARYGIVADCLEILPELVRAARKQ